MNQRDYKLLLQQLKTANLLLRGNRLNPTDHREALELIVLLSIQLKYNK